MLKTAFTLGIVCALFTTASADAALRCSKANLMKVESALRKNPKGRNKDIGLKQLRMARGEMARHQRHQCMLYLERAKDAIR